MQPVCPAELKQLEWMNFFFLFPFSLFFNFSCFSAATCPYSEINLNKDRIFPDRLSGEMPPASPSFPRSKRADTNEISSSPETR